MFRSAISANQLPLPTLMLLPDCGLLEIAEHVDEPDKNLYRSYAELIIQNTAETCCSWDPETDSIVQNCKVAFHNDRREQTDLIYADYFLTEAILRLRGKDFLIW